MPVRFQARLCRSPFVGRYRIAAPNTQAPSPEQPCRPPLPGPQQRHQAPHEALQRSRAFPSPWQGACRASTLKGHPATSHPVPCSRLQKAGGQHSACGAERGVFSSTSPHVGGPSFPATLPSVQGNTQVPQSRDVCPLPNSQSIPPPTCSAYPALPSFASDLPTTWGTFPAFHQQVASSFRPNSSTTASEKPFLINLNPRPTKSSRRPHLPSPPVLGFHAPVAQGTLSCHTSLGLSQ